MIKVGVGGMGSGTPMPVLLPRSINTGMRVRLPMPPHAEMNWTNMPFHKLPHPGKVLADELQERGISQSALASHIGVLSKTINEICRGKRGISAAMAMKLSMALGASAEFWLNLQKNWELS